MKMKYLTVATVALLAAYSAKAWADGKNGVAAVVNGENVMVADIKKGYDDNQQVKDKVKFGEFYEKALDIFVNTKVLLQAAEGAKIKSSPEYKAQLSLVEDELARKIFLEKTVNSKLGNKELKKMYDEYKKTFKSEPEVKAKHILVDSEAKAKEVIAKLKKDDNFDKLAKEYSKEPAELGWFTKSMMVPEFGNAAFSLKEGKFSQVPVKTQYGYHVIYIEDTRNSKPVDYKTAEPQLKSLLAQQVIAQTFQDLMKNAKVTKYDLDGKVLPNTPIEAQLPAAAAPAKK